MEKYEPMEGVFTSNAENLQVKFSFEEMTVYFFNWEGRPIMLKFKEVLAYRCGPFLEKAPRNDAAYVVKDSEWIQNNFAALKTSAATSVSDEDFLITYKHYKLCFNALDFVVDIIAKSFESI